MTGDAPAIDVIEGADVPLAPPTAEAPPLAPDAPLEGTGPGIITEEVIAPIVDEAFKAAARRRGAHWELDATELHNIAEPLAGEVDELLASAPFLGDAVASLGSRRMRLAVALGTAIVPRVMQDAAYANQRNEAAHQAAMQPTRDTATPRPIRPDTEWASKMQNVELTPEPA